MGARASLAAMAALAAVASVAHAEPKPKPVDIKAYRDKLVVLQDPAGGTYVVMSEHGGDAHLFYGTGKTLYEQIVINRSFNDEAWDVHVLAPRVAEMRNGSVLRKQDRSYTRFCGASDETPLKELTGDKAKQVLDKSQFLSTALVRRAHLLARDDHGVYYYVDAIRDQYGGKGYRVFVGKKGAMKELPLVDIASDSAGQVFATKTGELRLVTQTQADDAGGRNSVTWVRGEKKTPLVSLDTDVNSPVIYGELGVYSFIGTICESL